MKHFIRSTLLVLSLFSVPVFAGAPQKAAPEETQETITLRAGNAKSLTIPNVTRIALGDTECADVKTVGGNVIRIEGKKAGETTLLIWTQGKDPKSYRIVVK